MRERNSNIEFLRIISMMGIVALHYVHGGIGGVENFSAYPNFTWFFVSGVRSIAVPLVNVFVLITGFFMIRSTKLLLRKVINLLVVAAFYGLLFYFVNIVLDHGVFNLLALVKSVFPIFFGSAWFIKTYIVLMLIAPFLNKLLLLLDKNKYRWLLLIQIILFSVWYSIGLSSPIEDDGYGIINFITLYMVGGYLGRFLKECSILNKISGKRAFIFYCISVLLTAIASIFLNPFGYAFITNIAGATMLFLSIVKLKERSNRVINILSSNAFDVFFVHTFIFRFMNIESVSESLWLIPHLIITVICCYLAGFILGFIRTFIIKNTVDKLLDKSQVLNNISL